MEKINWMLGMTQNMMNMAESNMDKGMMQDMYEMTSAMMGNLNYMKAMRYMPDEKMMDLMEGMMRSMEGILMNIDMGNEKQMMMMRDMMKYMVSMQMMMLIDMK